MEELKNEKQPVKGHDIKAEIHIEVVDDGKKDPDEITLDNGLLPWGSIFLICVIVDVISFVAFCNMKHPGIVGDIFLCSMVASVIFFIPLSNRIDKKIDSEGGLSNHIGQYY